MSLIEKAVQRLDQLKQADAEPAPPVSAPRGLGDERPPAPEAAMARVSAAPELSGDTIAKAPPAQSEPTPPAQVVSPAADLASSRGVGGPSARPQRVFDIDLKRLAAMGMVTPDKPRSQVAEQFRVIKRPLIRNFKGGGAAPVDNGNLIMVTSSLPGEGKSFSSINLAISMAMELDFTVLLVDADFSKPSVLSRLGLPVQKGLMDVLQGEVDDLSEVITRTNIEKLAILPAGNPHPRPTEMIASDAMANLLAEMATRYHDRIIVFDSPPLLATTEARVLATHMGQIVLVVEANRTSHGAVRQALSTIELCPVKLMLLNKATSKMGNDLYGYGYGYGYTYGSDSGAKAAG
ncbi:MAG: XrtA-associated tyrosine autokinase [Rhodocyclaceae bacterium]